MAKPKKPEAVKTEETEALETQAPAVDESPAAPEKVHPKFHKFLKGKK